MSDSQKPDWANLFKNQPMIMLPPPPDPDQQLLEQYAGQALQGILAGGPRITQVQAGFGTNSTHRQVDDTVSHIVDRAWTLAAAMLEEAQNRRPNPLTADQQDELLKLQQFKLYVHKRLDEVGVAKHEDKNALNGCRIGARLEDVLRTAGLVRLTNREYLEKQINEADNSFGYGAWRDGQNQIRLDDLKAQLAAPPADE